MKKWSGDGIHKLPAQQVEPYRLWFEFLKLAHKDPSVKIDNGIYKDWGDLEGVSFSDWWSAKWRSLFSVDVGVYELIDFDGKVRKTNQEVVIRVPLYQDTRKSLNQIAEILEQHKASSKIKDAPAGQFHLYVGHKPDGTLISPSTRFLKNLDKVRLLYHLYRFWIDNLHIDRRRRLDQTVRDYYQWASTWNAKIARKKDGTIGKRPQIEIPDALWYYHDHLMKKGDRRRVLLSELNETDHVNHRRQLARYIEKAERIACNVGRGEFPGVYETGGQSAHI